MSGAPARLLPVDALTIGHDFRLDDDAEQMAELAASVAQLGVLQPLVVRKAGGGYEVVAGRRRLAAARSAGLECVPCVVRELDDSEAEDVALAENLHRRRLSPIEEALAYARMRARGLTLTEVSIRAGKGYRTVCNMVKLLTLPEGMQQKVHAGEWAWTTAMDRWKRSHGVGGGASTRGVATSGMDAVASHWRRRHDRLLAGLYAVEHVAKDVRQLPRVLEMLQKLIKLDKQPLDDAQDRAAP